MEQLNGLTALVVLAIAIAFNAIIFYLIVRAAVNAGAETQKRLKHAWAQTELLMAMARKQGVDDAQVKAIADGLR